jgi:transcriptional antiterminator NusG
VIEEQAAAGQQPEEEDPETAERQQLEAQEPAEQPQPEAQVAAEQPQPEEPIAAEQPQPEEVANEQPQTEEPVAAEQPEPAEQVPAEQPEPEEVTAEEPQPDEQVPAEQPEPEEMAVEEPQPEEPVAAEQPQPVEQVTAQQPEPEEVTAEEPRPEEAVQEEQAAPPVRKEPAAKKPRSKAKENSKAAAAIPATDEELFQPGRAWYVVHTYSGYEDKVRTNLEQRIRSMDAEDLVFRVIVPSVDEMEIRDGQRRTVPKKIFPGYVLVQMITLQEEGAKSNEQEMARSNKAWMVVRNSPGVTGFVGSGTAPTPLDKEEVRSIMKQMRAEEPVVKVGFTTGQSVRVVDGPFADFVGVVDEINVEKGKVKVLVSMMGRETPVELDFLQVERL